MPVIVSQPSPEHDAAAAKLVAELRSEGYFVQWLSYPANAPCDDPARAAAAPSRGIWIEVTSAAQPGQVAAIICYRPTPGALDQTRVSAPLDDPQRIAIAAVEALNGLRSGPRRAPAPERRPPEDAASPAATPALGRALVGGAVVFDATGVGPVFGAEIALFSSFAGDWSAGIDAFVPVTAAEDIGPDRTLRLRAASVRLGLRRDWALNRAQIFGSLEGGPALVWATSEPTPPLIGTTKLAAAAMVSLAAGFVYPSDSLAFVHVRAGVSRLIPEVRLQIDANDFHPFGRVLLDASLGFGLRWK
jgi:hypothetical protein